MIEEGCLLKEALCKVFVDRSVVKGGEDDI